MDFTEAFPDFLPLVSILSMLSTSQPFSTIIPQGQRRAYYIEVLIWLLKTDLVIQLRECYRVITTPKIRKHARDARRLGGSSDDADSKEERTDDGGESSFDGRILYNATTEPKASEKFSETGSLPSSELKGKGRASLVSAQSPPEPSPEPGRNRPVPSRSSLTSIPRRDRPSAPGKAAFASSAMAEPLSNVIEEPGMPTIWEKRYLSQIMASQPEHAEEFEKILSYLNGSFDVEQIAFRSGQSRKEVKRLVNRFQEHIVTFWTP